MFFNLENSKTFSRQSYLKVGKLTTLRVFYACYKEIKISHFSASCKNTNCRSKKSRAGKSDRTTCLLNCTIFKRLTFLRVFYINLSILFRSVIWNRIFLRNLRFENHKIYDKTPNDVILLCNISFSGTSFLYRSQNKWDGFSLNLISWRKHIICFCLFF